MDLKKLSPGEMVISVSGIVLLIFSFFKWYGVGGEFEEALDAAGVRSSFNGWQAPSAFLSVVAILLGVVMVAHIITDKVAGVEMPERIGKVGWGVFYFAGGVIAFLFVFIKFIGNTDDTKIGIYVGLLSTAGLAAGGFLVAKERGHLAELTAGGPGTPPAPPAA
jgi:hypothetical protein